MTRMNRRPRIAIGGILTECNHFGGLPIDLKTYEENELLRGEEVLSCDTSVVGGMLEALRTESADPVPLLYATACAGGPIVASCYARLRGELLDGLWKALPVDGVLMPIHGSALAEGNDDPEGDMIHAVRRIVGPDTPSSPVSTCTPTSPRRWCATPTPCSAGRPIRTATSTAPACAPPA